VADPKAVTVDMTDVKLLRAKLGELSEKSVPYAVRNALNTIAFTARKEWIGRMERSLTLRNKFTANSVRVEKAKGSDLATMQSQVGSVAPYMLSTEAGATESAKGKHGVPIPTSTAAGQAMKGRRTKEVRKANWQSAIKLGHRVQYGVRQYRNAVAIAEAAKTGGVTFLDLGRRKGLFRVTGTAKGRLRVRMIWDMSKRSVRIKAHPTLEPTVESMTYKGPRILELALQQQIDRALAKLAK
jgi:hypothetical protein